jgi:hypothetical protein|tara:strand:- start:263 stop:916 length:654 start_codon:yes stop_codon:yes gene_type:complete
MSIKDIYKVESIKPKETHDWLLNKHYAKRIPSISYSFGLFDNKNVLIGVCTFGSPPSHYLCIGVCGKKYYKNVIELNRLCINNHKIKNLTSFFVSNCLKKINKNYIVVSYADTSKNHNGYIYQATNWIYTGLSAKRTERYDKKNPNKHSKTVTESMNYNDLSVRERPQKHRYVIFIGTKKFKHNCMLNLKYSIQEYPKGNNINYDASYKPTTQVKLF